jgi:hypothetical protein
MNKKKQRVRVSNVISDVNDKAVFFSNLKDKNIIPQ